MTDKPSLEELGSWLDEHNARTQREQERLEKGLPLRATWREDFWWHVSIIALRMLWPTSKLQQRIMRWQHGHRAKMRERANGPW